MFVKNKKYYDGIVYEFNLPSGWSCPFASDCLVKVDQNTGKFNNQSKSYKCYSASSERFPSVRKSRWNNFNYVKENNVPIIPKDCKAIRIHASGDFFSQKYFDMWINLAKNNTHIEFWAYTKSINYWVNRFNEIPTNLQLTASYGGKFDDLIKLHNLKNVKVYNSLQEIPDGILIDTNDNLARDKSIKEFALLNNFKK